VNIYFKKNRWLNNRRIFIKSGKNILIIKVFTFSLILVILIFSLNLFSDKIKNYFYITSSPISFFLSETGNEISSIFESLFNTKNLKNQNNFLEKENQRLLLQVSFLQESLKENFYVKESLNNKFDDFKLVLVKTVGLDIANDFILIDKGLEDGVLKDMALISNQNVLYGKVFKVYKNFSQVMLISNRNNTLNTKINLQTTTEEEKNNILDIKPIYGIVKGSGALSGYLDLINIEDEIKEEDVLLTSGMESILPSNLLVGKIKSVNKEDLKPFQTAEVELFLDIKDIENLFLITDYIKK